MIEREVLRTPGRPMTFEEQASACRGTPDDAPTIRKRLDALCWAAPDDQFGTSLLAWAEEVTRLLDDRRA